MADEKHSKCPFEGDALIPGPPVPGGMLCLHHAPDHKIRMGTLVEHEDGKPIPEDARLVTEENGRLVIHESIAQLKAGGQDKPAQVATSQYREGWEQTFGKQRVGLA